MFYNQANHIYTILFFTFQFNLLLWGTLQHGN